MPHQKSAGREKKKRKRREEKKREEREKGKERGKRTERERRPRGKDGCKKPFILSKHYKRHRKRGKKKLGKDRRDIKGWRK